MALGHQLSLRLFLEGVEVPVIGATVSVVPNAPTAATVQVIATDRILKILPRTVVHLFFYDYVDAAYPLGTTPTDGVTHVDLNASANDQAVDIFNRQYKLLFMGEVQGIQFQKGHGQRAVMLTCIDFSNYWDTTYQYNFKGSLFGGRRNAAFIGANANFFTSPLGHGVGTIAALLNGKSVNFPNLKGLLAGIIRCLEAIGGSYYGDTTFRGANQFTSIAELRCKILQQITAAEKDDTTAKLFARKAFNMWMNRQMGSLGKLVTFRGITHMLQRFIFHEIWSCPSPKYVPSVGGLKKKKTWATNITKDPRTRSFITEIKKLRGLLTSAKTNLESYVDEATAKALRASEADLTSSKRLLGGLVNNIPKAPGIVKHVTDVDAALKKVKKKIGSKVRGGFTLSPEKMTDSSKTNSAIQDLGRALSSIEVLLGTKIKHAKTVTYSKLERVNNQILRPDIWFAPAPRCNILFPEFYYSFNWSRNFLREVSRIELQTTNEILGDDALFNGRYYAPNVADMRSGIRLSSRKFGRLILKHELLTGIIPMYEKMSEANLFAMKSRKVKHKGAKVGYAQRAVNFQYFKHRFASRQMQAQGRFNPWFVAGFPSVLIDKPMDAASLAISGLPIAEQLSALNIIPEKGVEITRATLLRQLVPVQYIGSCVSLQHSLNQQGGNTSYAFMQARVHREDTEFLGVDKAVVSKKIGEARKTSVYAALSSKAPKAGNRGPRGGRVSVVADVSGQYAGRMVQLLNGKTSVKVGSQDNVYAAFASTTDGQSNAPQSGTDRFKAYRIVERFVRREKVKVDLPIEEAIRPPWIWDGWSNLKIGETYMDLFGTNSLCDIEGFTSRDLLTSVLEGTDTVRALTEAKEGLAGGSGAKKNESDQAFLERLEREFDEQDKPRKNKPAKKGAGGTTQQTNDEKISIATILTMEKERTIENCIDYLVRVYSLVEQNGLDVGSFIRNFTWRPVADMVEILGSSNFTIKAKEAAGPVQPGEDPPTIKGEYAIYGAEGFHSRAFSDESDLFGLVNPNVKKILGLTKEKQAAAERLDVRGRRRSVIREYVEELTNSRGLLG